MVTAIELTPEGTGYRAKTRFAKFYNLPELMAMFKEVADIKTADMLNLPVPEAEYHNVSVEPSEMQKEMVASLAERAEKVRGGGVDSSVDNMLKITNDGRKLALDQRMLNAMLPDFENSKINACVDNVYRIWEENKDKKSAQLVLLSFQRPFLTIRQNSLYVTVCIIVRPSYRGYFIHSLSTLHYCNAPSLATRLTGDYRDRTYTG